MRLQSKLSLAFLATVLIPIAVLGVFCLQHNTRSLTNIIMDTGLRDLQTRAEKIELFFTRVTQDTLLLSKISSVQGIVRARANQGWDRQGNASYEQQVDRCHGTAASFPEAKPHYQRIAYMDEHGRELARVDRTDGEVAAAPPAQLQDRSDAEYVRETLQLPPGTTGFSALRL